MTVSATPASAKTSPISAARSSSRMAGSSGALARRINARHPFRPRTRFVSCTAVRSEKLSRPIAMIRTTKATTGEWIGSGLMILWTPSYSENTAPTVNSTTATMNA